MKETLRRLWHWFRPRPPSNFGELLEATRSDVLAIPICGRPWNEKVLCNSFAIVPSRKLHESGWGKMGIVACLPDGSLLRFATSADDIEPHITNGFELDPGNSRMGAYRFDCLLRSGLVHVWSSGCQIEIQSRLSSVDFYLKERERVPR